MPTDSGIKKFFMPRLNSRYLVRLVIVAFSAWLCFSYILIPIQIKGISMEPTYADGGFNFILRPAFNELKRQDIVGVRLAGKNVMLLKRIIGLEGETVEFRKGRLFVDGKIIHEAYVVYRGNWDLPPRKVAKGNVYVVGDNRNMPSKNHVFGQTSLKRIIGTPLW